MRDTLAGIIEVDRDQGGLQEQLYNSIKSAVLSGRLPSGTILPSTRSLSRTFSIARTTVIAAFDRLKAEGYIEASHGSCTRIASVHDERPLHTPGVPDLSPPARHASARGLLLQSKDPPSAIEMRAFRAGVPDVSQFPHEDWSRCLSGRSRSLRVHDLSYASLAGIPELRQAIVDHVSELRGVVAHSEQVIIVPSTQAAIDICARVLMDAGEVAWIEDPGYLGARAALNASGARLVAVPCDEEGLVVPNPHLPAPRLIYATPSHQYPTGATMSLQRRVALLNLAEQLDAFILEDDYDSDFRYRERPIAALQGIDGGRRVIYLGTFSKVLAPGLHVAFLIAPPAVAKLIGDAIATTGQIVSVHIQAALADFIRGGYLRTHIRKMRTCYASRLDCAIGALAHHCGSMASIKKPPGGLQLCAELPDGYDDVAICAELARVGVAAMPLSRFFLGPARPGLLLGFALPQENEIQTAARSIACVLRTYSAERRAG